MIEFIISVSGSTIIRNLGLVAVAVIALPLVLWRSVIAERQLRTAQRQVLDGRFHTGAEMLGNPHNLAVRLGGIYALARLAKEYPKEFHLQVMEVFGAYVAARKSINETTGNVLSQDNSHTLACDSDRDGSVSALDQDSAVSETLDSPMLPRETKEIMRVIAERDNYQITLETKENFRINLTGAYLAGLSYLCPNFSNINFTNANLRQTSLSGACFNGAIFHGCDFSEARLIADFRGASPLHRVNFRGTDFSGVLSAPPVRATVLNAKRRNYSTSLNDLTLVDVDFRDSNLSGVSLRETRLSSMVKLDRTNLSGADISGAYLVGVSGLTKEQLEKAIADCERPPCLKDVVDSKTGEPVVWRGQGRE